MKGLVFIAGQVIDSLGKLQFQITFAVAGVLGPLGKELSQFIHTPLASFQSLLGNLNGFFLFPCFPVETGQIVVVGAINHAPFTQIQVFVPIAKLAVDAAGMLDFPVASHGLECLGQKAQIPLVIAGGVG